MIMGKLQFCLEAAMNNAFQRCVLCFPTTNEDYSEEDDEWLEYNDFQLRFQTTL
jgi:hypothetical protein